ncbi:DinB family protein [Tenacibaculum xiamenense]|uniref:DinB family protein n=1 Tax=Tenacibaculum xiamenense TaxID=1261553 RepID=UPI00389372A8
MIEAIDENLQRGIKLLNSINDEEYCNKSVAPYYSSIGTHMRHVLDVFSCIFKGLDTKNVDFSDRERNTLAEEWIAEGLKYFEEIRSNLLKIDSDDFNKLIYVTDDLGKGSVTVQYTLGSALVQAHSHAIHHFASVGYIINQLGIQLPDADFGYNPTTPKEINKS